MLLSKTDATFNSQPESGLPVSRRAPVVPLTNGSLTELVIGN
jgi:hypothetical protein